tara:strand:- start:3563 stop:4834 length:1272 start_codon:yes stop_codon:yes gene_type:complete
MSENKKIKILMLGDSPFAPSGVGTQLKYICEALLKTDNFTIINLGGALKHADYKPQRTEEYGEDWTVIPVDGYGTQEMIRSVIWTEKPDLLFFMTDPRYWAWLWEIENEIRPHIPMVYYHVWDNYPYPKYNDKFYQSTDVVFNISKVTHDIVTTVSPNVEAHYLPHAVNSEVFQAFSEETIAELKEQHFEDDQRFTFFWNNRNARRKMSGSLIHWFNEFAEQVGPENVRLIMHTDPKDKHGQDLAHIINHLEADDGRIMLSTRKIPPEALAVMYNISDCTINISDAEGFGLATLESLSCGTPIIVSMTGGLQEQVTDGKKWFGIGIEPSSKAVIGSQSVPYIYEDRISKEDFINALREMYKMSKTKRKKMISQGKKHVAKNYNFKDFTKRWVDEITSIHERHGSWETRQGYKTWEIKEVGNVN